MTIDLDAINAERERIKDEYLQDTPGRPESSTPRCWAVPTTWPYL
jgi:hypothetical protein